MSTSLSNPAMPEQPLSIPRREMDVEDYIDILRRHRSWILGPAFLGLVAGVVTAFLWPNSYRAEGSIRVVPPQISARMVESNITAQMTQRINTTYQSILSRPRLKNLIQTHNLYPDELKRLPTNDVMDMVRKDVGLGRLMALGRGMTGAGNESAFTVSFSYSDRRVAQKVCLDLISQFVDEDVKVRSLQSEGASGFFKEQYALAKADLEQLETKIGEFRSRNMGQLPEQEQMVISRLTAMEAGIQSANAQINRSTQDKVQLESLLRELRETAQLLAQAAQQELSAEVPVAARSERVVQIDREIEQLEANLTVARQTYKEGHPDVQRLLTYLQSKKTQREQILKDLETAKPDGAAPRQRMAVRSPSAEKLRESNSAIMRVQTALQAKDLEIEDGTRQLRDLQGRLRTTQARLETSPASSQEYVQLMRDRELATSRYNDLSKKMQSSSMANDLEARKQGENLEVLEFPVIPEEPYAPKRPLIIAAGVILGAALGSVLAAGREMKDTSLKNLKDVRAYTKLTILGSIPLLENDFVVRRRRRLAWLLWTGAFLLGILMMAGAVVFYYTSRA